MMKKKKRMSPKQELELIQHALGYATFQTDEDEFEHLDLGDLDANEVFGDRERGIRWGCIVEIHGPESSGKTLVATQIASIGQASDSHVYVGKACLEDKDDDRFNTKFGIDLQRWYPFEARLAVKMDEINKRDAFLKKQDDVRQKEKSGKRLTSSEKRILSKKLPAVESYEQSAEQVCDEIEAWIKFRRESDPKAKFILIIDSVTGMLVSEEDDAGLSEQNMRTKVSLASFLSILCRRWRRLCSTHKIIFLFINQERMAPGVMYGSPIVTSGGRALKFYASTRVRITRAKSGKVMKDKIVIGIRSIMTNEKNKLGGQERSTAAFKAFTRTGKFLWMSTYEALKEAKSAARKPAA